MSALMHLPEPLRGVALDRGGVAAGLTPRRIRTVVAGSSVLLPGVYDVVRADGDLADRDLVRRCWAGLLHAGEGGIVHGAAALTLHGMSLDPAVVDVAVPNRVKVRSAGSVQVHRLREMPPPTRRRGVPVARAEDAVLLLARTPRDALHWVTAACQQRITTPARVQQALARRPRHPCRALVSGLAQDAASGATTVLEVVFRRDVLRAHGLPEGVGQLVVPGSSHPSDIGYEAERLLLELDSVAHHSGPDRFTDLSLDIGHLTLGWATVRYGWPHATVLACTTARSLADLLLSRGAQFRMRRCPRCP